MLYLKGLNKSEKEDLFYLVNLDDIYDKHIAWLNHMPRVHPFYAIKSNNDKLIIKLLAHLGVNFDCASMQEMKNVLSVGVEPNRIIYAHPCKDFAGMAYARDHGIEYVTFDNEAELYKLKEQYPNVKALLRIKTSNENVLFKLSLKYGAAMDSSYRLIQRAIELGVNLVGISFHIGSLCS
jgi:ornithine decarboxylase